MSVQLSIREEQVLKGVICGKRMQQIADELHLSLKTVATYKYRVRDKIEGASGVVRPTDAYMTRWYLAHIGPSGVINLEPINRES